VGGLREVINNDPLFGNPHRDNDPFSITIPSDFPAAMHSLPTGHPLIRSVAPFRQQIGFFLQSAPDHLLINP
jgi:hypothetical protein